MNSSRRQDTKVTGRVKEKIDASHPVAVKALFPSRVKSCGYHAELGGKDCSRSRNLLEKKVIAVNDIWRIHIHSIFQYSNSKTNHWSRGTHVLCRVRRDRISEQRKGRQSMHLVWCKAAGMTSLAEKHPRRLLRQWTGSLELSIIKPTPGLDWTYSTFSFPFP